MYKTNVATALVLLTTFIRNIVDGHIQLNTANFCVKGDDDVFYFGVTQEHCIDMCKDRRMCESVNYKTHKLMCILHFQTTKEDKCPVSGSIHSRKSDWNYDIPATCELCTADQTCQKNDMTDKYVCTFQQCKKPSTPRYGQLLGNRLTVGSRIMYTCYPGFKMDPPAAASQVCQTNGQWSGDAPNCRPGQVCPRGWTELLSVESCYYIDFGVKLPFDDATAVCKGMQPRSHLLTIETEEEYGNISKLLDGRLGNMVISIWTTIVWEGIVSLGSAPNRNWLYQHTNTPVSWNKWAPFEPSNNLEDVGCLYKHSSLKWLENDCSRNFTFVGTVCEIEWKDVYQ